MFWLVLYPWLLLGYRKPICLTWEYTKGSSWRSTDHLKIQVRADFTANILLPILNMFLSWPKPPKLWLSLESWRQQFSGDYKNIGGYGYNKRVYEIGNKA